MIDAGGITVGGLLVAGGIAACVLLPLLASYVADEVRIYFGVRGEWAAERRSHHHGADGDDHGVGHGLTVDGETNGRASGKSAEFAGGGRG